MQSGTVNERRCDAKRAHGALISTVAERDTRVSLLSRAHFALSVLSILRAVLYTHIAFHILRFRFSILYFAFCILHFAFKFVFPIFHFPLSIFLIPISHFPFPEHDGATPQNLTQQF